MLKGRAFQRDRPSSTAGLVDHQVDLYGKPALGQQELLG